MRSENEVSCIFLRHTRAGQVPWRLVQAPSASIMVLMYLVTYMYVFCLMNKSVKKSWRVSLSLVRSFSVLKVSEGISAYRN